MVPIKPKVLSLRDLSRILRPITSDQLTLPESWTELLNEFEDAAKDGATGVVIINGTSGSGKTSFTKILQKNLTKHEGIHCLWGTVMEPISTSGWLIPFLSDIVGGPSSQQLTARAVMNRLSDLCPKDGSTSLLLIIDGADLLTSEALIADLGGLLAMIEESGTRLLTVINANQSTTGALLSAPSLHNKSIMVRSLPKIADSDLKHILEKRIELGEIDNHELKKQLSSVIAKSRGIPSLALKYLLDMVSIGVHVEPLNAPKTKSRTHSRKNSFDTDRPTYDDLLTIKKSGS